MEKVISEEVIKELESRNWLSIPCSEEAMDSLCNANVPSNWLIKEFEDV